MRRDIVIHFRALRLDQHPPGTLPHNLIDQRRRAILAAFLVALNPRQALR
jgi:hypothetical protein